MIPKDKTRTNLDGSQLEDGQEGSWSPPLTSLQGQAKNLDRSVVVREEIRDLSIWSCQCMVIRSETDDGVEEVVVMHGNLEQSGAHEISPVILQAVMVAGNIVSEPVEIIADV